MKKIFLILSAFMLTVSMWATTYTLQPGENNISAAMASLVDGDVIELQTGTYYEWNTLEFSTKVTLKAAEGATPIVQPNVIKIKNDFEANGITFINLSKDNYLLRTGADVAGTIAIKNCNLELNAEVSSPVPYIYLSSNTVGNLVIDNCSFAPNAKTDGAIVYGLTTVNNFTMTNSTAVACGGTDLAVYMKTMTTATVDHCTFYNCGARVLYLPFNDAMTSCTVSNCIVANAALVDQYCVATYGGTVDNVLYYNTKAPRSSDATVTGCVNADPQFIDPANGNLNFAFTSPLFLAATDGTHIGDPRWTVEAGDDAIIIPATLTKDDATLTGPKIKKTADGIAWGDNVNVDQDYASWVVDIAKAGNYGVIVNVSDNSTTTHNFSVSLYGNTGLIETRNEPSETSGTGAKNCGTMSIATAGKYMVRLTNATPWSSATAESVSFTYLGGAVVDLPNDLPIDDALFSGEGKRENGMISFSGDYTNSWIKWNTNIAKAGSYDVTLSIDNEYGHNFTVSFYDENDQFITSTTEGKTVYGAGHPSVLNLGKVSLPVGKGYVKITESVGASGISVVGLNITYAGGAVMPIPGQLPGVEALLAGKVVRLENGSFQWPDKSDVDNHYATWNVTATAAGDVDIYLYLGTHSSGHQFTAALYDGETLKSSVAESQTVHTTGKVELGSINIPAAGSYTLRLTNAQEWSSTIVDSIVVKAAEGPIVLTISEDATDNADLVANIDNTVNVNLVRSMPTDMFSTICLPFGASKSGPFAGAEIYYLDSTALHGDEVVLYFKENSDFYQGVPYIVKPATEVNNPTFENVVIKKTEGGSTERTHAIFRGTFVQKHLTAGNENLLYLGQNNMLYFPEAGDESSMKGLRGYFEIKQEAGAPIRRASIRMGSNVVTTLDFVDGQAVPNGVFMLNGQIEIRVNGQKYMLNGSQK